MDAPRRDDELLAQQLDRLLAESKQAVNSTPGDDPLLNTAHRFIHAPQPRLSPEAFARIQAKVQQAHEQQYSLADDTRSSGRKILHVNFAPMLRWAAAAAVILIMGLGGLLPASAASLPGDTLYPVKLGMERVETALAFSDSVRAKTYLRQAERRVDEGAALLERQQFNEQVVSAALQQMERASTLARQAGLSPREIEELTARTMTVSARLNSVVQQAVRTALIPEERALALADTLMDAQAEGRILLPAPVPTIEPTPTETVTPSETVATVTVTESASPTATRTFTPSPTVTATLTASPAATLTFTAMPSDTSAPDMGLSYVAYVISSQRVNVRSGPGLQYEVILQLNPGDAVLVNTHDSTGTWLQIRLPDERTGWVAAALLGDAPPTIWVPSPIISTPPSPAPVELPLPTREEPPGDRCDLPGAACTAPGHGTNPPPGHGGQPPGQLLTPPGQSK